MMCVFRRVYGDNPDEEDDEDSTMARLLGDEAEANVEVESESSDDEDAGPAAGGSNAAQTTDDAADGDAE